MPRPNAEKLRDYLLRHVASHPRNIAALAMERFATSRVTINRYLNQLISENLIVATGTTSDREYRLVNFIEENFSISLSHGLSESAVWDYRIKPLMKGLAPNLIEICQHGFTEMLNNAIDHSGSAGADIFIRRNYAEVQLWISDDGIGIFEKIQRDHHLEDPRHALLELAKGKLTSDPANHQGEGIYFTSRMMDEFSIRSGHLFYLRLHEKNDEWLIEVDERIGRRKGTRIFMRLCTDQQLTLQKLFAKYQGDPIGFRRTHVPLNLARYGDEQLVSRSQARRILARFNRFAEVMLDFKDVPMIGQAFADEIFRVFKKQHPEIHITMIHATQAVKDMIDYVRHNQPE